MATLTRDEMLSPTEAARFLGVETQTLSAWRCTGRYSLPFVRVGRAIRYRRSDLEAFVESRTATSCAEFASK